MPFVFFGNHTCFLSTERVGTLQYTLVCIFYLIKRMYVDFCLITFSFLLIKENIIVWLVLVVKGSELC